MLKNASKEADTEHRVSCAVGCVDGIITPEALTHWAATRRVSLKPVLRSLSYLCLSCLWPVQFTGGEQNQSPGWALPLWSPVPLE